MHYYLGVAVVVGEAGVVGAGLAAVVLHPAHGEGEAAPVLLHHACACAATPVTGAVRIVITLGKLKRECSKAITVKTLKR